MKGIFVHFSVCIMIVAAMSVSAQAYSQEAQAAPFTRNQVIAQWKDGSDPFSFNQDGTCIITVNKLQCLGKWALNGNTISVEPKRLKWKKGDPRGMSHTFTLISVKSDKLVLETEDHKKIQLKKEHDLL